jgi:tRNA threonylcarbamoyladenosine biosynthesis protein TsaB
LVLGLETSTPQSSLCLAGPDGLVASATLGGRQAHGEFLAAALRFCLDRADVAIASVDGVAVSLGPGLYTGMRVGIATAAALAHARRLPVVGLVSLDLVAFPVRHAHHQLVCACLDARRRELFWALYRPLPGGVQRVSELRVGPASRLVGELEAVRAEGVLCVGDGALAHRDELEAVGAEVGSPTMASPEARSLTELAMPKFAREETQRPEELRPVYLRAPDARIDWRRRGALAGTASDPEGASGDAGTGEAASGGGMA